MKRITENIFLFASSLRLTPLGLALKIAPDDFVRDTMCRSLLIIHGNRVSTVLKPSCVNYTLRFSALASSAHRYAASALLYYPTSLWLCVALPRSLFPTRLYLLHPWSRPASVRSSTRSFLALMYRTYGMLVSPKAPTVGAEHKPATKKSNFQRSPNGG